MTEERKISPSHLPAEVLEALKISKAFVAKLGFVRYELNDEFWRRFEEMGEGESNVVKEYIEEIYSLLENSPHIMEIRPSRSEFLKEFSDGELWIRRSGHDQALSFDSFLSIRVVLPKRKRDEFSVFPWSWNPEEFELYFDGAHFIAMTEVDSVPLSTDIGQIARDFLVEILNRSNILKHSIGIGPTPIHPELYFLMASRKANDLSEPYLPHFQIARGDLVAVVSDDKPRDTINKALFRDVSFALSDFYEQRVANQNYSNTVSELEELDQHLNERVSAYFAQSPIRRLFSGESRRIRQLIAHMHSALRQISFCEKIAKKREEEARRVLAETNFLKHISPYFDEHMKSDVIFDRDAELSSMNFAATETNNFAVVQATVVAALIGAIIGGVLAILAK